MVLRPLAPRAGRRHSGVDECGLSTWWGGRVHALARSCRNDEDPPGAANLRGVRDRPQPIQPERRQLLPPRSADTVARGCTAGLHTEHPGHGDELAMTLRGLKLRRT